MGVFQDALRRGWLSLITNSVRDALCPAATPTVHASGPLPYRALLSGGGVAVGLGVTRRDRALPGHLARHLASITGRGVDLDVTAQVGMTVHLARAELDRRDLARYDAILLTLGVGDALARTPVADWRVRLESLLVSLINRTAPQARIVVVGADTSPFSPYLNSFLTRSPARRLADFNRVSRELCWSLTRTSYLAPVPKPSSDTTQYSVLDYDRIGRVAAAHLAQRLAFSSPSAVLPDSAPGRPLQESPELLGIGDEAAVHRVVARTRIAFGVEGATLTMLGAADAATGCVVGPRDQNRASPSASPHAATAAERGGLAVKNLRDDPRFRASSLALRHGVAFYAGYPVYAPTGECIAVLSISDPHPRTFSLQEMEVLRNHALLIQAVLARCVSRSPSRPGRRERPPRPEGRSAQATPTASPRHA